MLALWLRALRAVLEARVVRLLQLALLPLLAALQRVESLLPMAAPEVVCLREADGGEAIAGVMTTRAIETRLTRILVTTRVISPTKILVMSPTMMIAMSVTAIRAPTTRAVMSLATKANRVVAMADVDVVDKAPLGLQLTAAHPGVAQSRTLSRPRTRMRKGPTQASERCQQRVLQACD